MLNKTLKRGMLVLLKLLAILHHSKAEHVPPPFPEKNRACIVMMIFIFQSFSYLYLF